jgi:hypothetical protein
MTLSNVTFYPSRWHFKSSGSFLKRGKIKEPRSIGALYRFKSLFYLVLFHFLEPASRCATDRASLRGSALDRIAADLAQVIKRVFYHCAGFQVFSGGLEELMMDFLDLVGRVKAVLGFLITLGSRRQRLLQDSLWYLPLFTPVLKNNLRLLIT